MALVRKQIFCRKLLHQLKVHPHATKFVLWLHHRLWKTWKNFT